MGLLATVKKAMNETKAATKPTPLGDVTVGVKLAQPVKRGQLIVYKAPDGWRWHLWATNGKLVAESGEAYNRRYNCVESARALSARAAAAHLDIRSAGK